MPLLVMLPDKLSVSQGTAVWREASRVAGEQYKKQICVKYAAVIETGSPDHKLAERERVWNASSVFHSHRYHPIEIV